MKRKIMNFRHVALTIFLLICYQYNTLSQEADITPLKQSGLFVGFGLGSCKSQIKNEGILIVSELHSSSKNSLFGSAEIGFFFSDYFGLSSGIGYISYKTQLTLNTYQNNFNTIDSEKEPYERQVTGSDIKEIQNIGLLSIPFCINIRLPFSKTIGIFLQPGVNLAFPLSRNYQSSGAFTYKGYYPADNVLIENLPAYGFQSNLISNTDGELELKPLDINILVLAGFDFNIQKKIKIALAACFDKSLSSISQYPSPDDFRLSSDAGQINSLMGGSSKATLQSIGFKITLRYYMN